MSKSFKLILFLSIIVFTSLLSAKAGYALLQVNYQDGFDAYLTNQTLSQTVYISGSWNDTWQHFNCVAVGGDQCSNDPTRQQQTRANSMLAQVGNGITMAYQYKPASMAYYFTNLAQNAGFVKPAYAQGIGFSGLQPLLQIWKAFRNIAYGFLIIVMVLVGFMILFRMKIDPRTVISIQAAIPRIIVTLLLITFSYAIVGFMIDLMYLVIYTAIFALGQTSPLVRQHFTGGAITHLIGTVFTSGSQSSGAIAQFLGLATDGGVIVNLVGSIVGGAIGFGTAGAFGMFAGAILGAPSALLFLIVHIILFFLMIRIFFLLLTAWIQIIISMIFAPLQLMIGAIPGVNTFGSWFKNLAFNLATFPIVVIMLLIGTMISGIAQNPASQLWQPPGLGGAPGEGVASLISLGIILIIPSIIAGLKQSLKIQSPISIGAGTFTGGLGGAVGSIWTLGYQARVMGFKLPFNRKQDSDQGKNAAGNVSSTASGQQQ